MAEIGIGIIGCGGRMGRMLLAAALAEPLVRLAGGIDARAEIAGQDLGLLAGGETIGVPAGTDPAPLLDSSQVLIDFTTPAATEVLAGRAAAAGRALVVGTTGLGAGGIAALERAAERIPIVFAANFSLGVNLLLGLVEQAARRLGADYDIEILEMHHRLKVDAPSGTALALGRAAAAGRGRVLSDVEIRSRDGQTGVRPPGAIGFATLRGGEVVGEHSVLFAGPGEVLELTHRAADRRVFAQGALRAALWVADREPGLYGMRDVLGMSD